MKSEDAAAVKPTYENISYVEGIGHYRQKMDLYLPSHGRAPFAVILWLHGGAWQEGDKADVPLLGLLGAGIAIAAANYRLTGHAPFPAQIHDVKAAVRFLRANANVYGLDSERIMAAGFSAGGHLASLAGCSLYCTELEDPELGYREYSSEVCAVAAFAAPSTIRCTDEAQLASDVEMATLASPTRHVSADSPPHYIQHGSADDVVDCRHSERLAALLTLSGVDNELEIMPGLAHKMKLNNDVLDKLKALLNKLAAKSVYDRGT